MRRKNNRRRKSKGRSAAICRIVLIPRRKMVGLTLDATPAVRSLTIRRASRRDFWDGRAAVVAANLTIRRASRRDFWDGRAAVVAANLTIRRASRRDFWDGRAAVVVAANLTIRRTQRVPGRRDFQRHGALGSQIRRQVSGTLSNQSRVIDLSKFDPFCAGQAHPTASSHPARNGTEAVPYGASVTGSFPGREG